MNREEEQRNQAADHFDDTSSEMSTADIVVEVRPAVRRRSSRNSLRRCGVYNSALTKAAALLVKEEEESEEAAITGLADLNMAAPRRPSTRRSAVYNSVVTKAAALCVQEEDYDEEEIIGEESKDVDCTEMDSKKTDGVVAQSSSRRRQRPTRDHDSFCIKRPRRVSNEESIPNIHT